MEKKNTYLGNDGLLHCTVCNEAVEVKFDVPVMGITGHGRMCKCQRELQKQIEERQRQQEEHIVVNGRFCPQSVRNFCPIVAGFNAGTYKVPACVL